MLIVGNLDFWRGSEFYPPKFFTPLKMIRTNLLLMEKFWFISFN